MQTTALLTPPAHLPTVAPLAKERLFTGAEAFNLGIEQPFELVNGQIVLMDYTGDEHGIIESELSRYLGNFTATRKLGIVEPEKKQLLVYRSPTDFTQLNQQETVHGEGILEGFALPLHELFADLP